MISTNCYMFRHRSAIVRESTNTNNQQSNSTVHVSVALTVTFTALNMYSRIVPSQYFEDDSERHWYLNSTVGLVSLCVRGIPEDGTLVPKHVGAGTYHKLRFMIHILLYFITRICWLIYWGYLVKKKCTLVHVQALRLCTDRTARRGSRGIALPFHDHSTRRGEGSVSRLGHSLPPEKTRYPLYSWLGGPQGRSWQVRKVSPPIGIRSPDRAARSQSLYRLNYPAH